MVGARQHLVDAVGAEGLVRRADVAGGAAAGADDMHAEGAAELGDALADAAQADDGEGGAVELRAHEDVPVVALLLAHGARHAAAHGEQHGEDVLADDDAGDARRLGEDDAAPRDLGEGRVGGAQEMVDAGAGG